MDDPSTEVPSVPDRAAEARAGELVGTVISQRYRIDALLAVGGMGAVYRGQHLALKKRVAIKLLLPDTDNLPELVARFEREAIAGAHVDHPNVATATDFGQLEDGSYFLVLEFVAGKTLRQVGRAGPLPPARAVHIARQVAEALAAAHAMGIVHRDVKPHNVMLVDGKEDVAKLIDFGLAKVPVDRVVAQQSVRPPAGSLPDGLPARRARLDSIQDSKPRLTGVDVIMGTVAYLAPEAALGMDAVDARSDLYALGVVLYQMLSGRHPFDARNDAALFAQQRFTPPPPIAVRTPGVTVPPALEAVVMRLLAKDPAERFQTARGLIEALDAATAEAPPPSPTATPVTKPAPASARAYLPVAVGAAAVAAGVVAALIFNASSAGPHDGRPPPPLGAPVATAVATVATPVAAPEATAPQPPETVAPASASAAVPSAEPAAPLLLDPSGKRAQLQRALRVRDYVGGEAVFLDLVEHEPAVFHEPDMAVAARDLAVAVDRIGQSDRVFDALVGRLGSDGLDVLYDLVATKGRATAAVRAATLLRRKGVLARATDEMRIAFQLREASCVDKLGLLDRAARQGDGRALVVLQTQGVACFKKNNHAVHEAMTALRSRLSRGQ